jgi:hypothetical protein
MITRRHFSALSAAAIATTSTRLEGVPHKVRAAMIGTGHGHAGSKVLALRAMPEYEFVGV